MRAMSLLLGYVEFEVPKNCLGKYDYKTGKILIWNCGGRATNIFGGYDHIGSC